MTDIREYTAMKYMGDCKCGKCQLVPRDVLDEWITSFDVLMAGMRLIGSTAQKNSLTDYERVHDIKIVVGRVLKSLGADLVGGSSK